MVSPTDLDLLTNDKPFWRLQAKFRGSPQTGPVAVPVTDAISKGGQPDRSRRVGWMDVEYPRFGDRHRRGAIRPGPDRRGRAGTSAEESGAL